MSKRSKRYRKRLDKLKKPRVNSVGRNISTEEVKTVLKTISEVASMGWGKLGIIAGIIGAIVWMVAR